MKTEAIHHHAANAGYTHRVADAMKELKSRLQTHYERLHPRQPGLVHTAIDDAEALAWRLSSFPHLFLPDLVETRIAEIALHPATVDEPAFSRAA
ncbi:MAG TPA: hypothetical protein VGH90_13585 [Chthoniobacteraceae bacterium]|jgi:hypothetical protein